MSWASILHTRSVMRAHRLALLVLVSWIPSACGDSRSVNLEDAAPPLDTHHLDAGPARDVFLREGAVVADLPPPRDAIVGCATNAGCLASEYCHLDSGCLVTGAKMGTCTARPLNCPEYYSPTCGCDGKTYGNPCDAHGAGTNVAYPGTCQSCGDINTAYQAAVLKAKKCCAMCDSIQCTLKAKTELACPCTTYVEASNQAAVQEMSQLEAKWIAAACTSSGCPPVPCPQVGGASCGFGATEVCIDNP